MATPVPNHTGATTVGDWQVVTPSDSQNFFPSPVSGLYVGTTGNLVVVSQSGNTCTITGAAVGYHPLRCVRVNSTGTTASAVVALF